MIRLTYKIVGCFIFLLTLTASAQPFNRAYLLGYSIALFDTNVTATKAKLIFDASSYQLLPETRKMPFRAAQATISDSLGNVLIASNGCWIADATGDTMQNGAGLNPNSFTSAWCDATTGIPYSHSNILIPNPGHPGQYYLIHETGDNNSPGGSPSALYSTLIDLSLNGGLGGVLQKNTVLLAQYLAFGITACKHANGRDWWIIALKANTNQTNLFLLTPSGIQYNGLVTFGFGNHFLNSCSPQFSMNGEKFAYLYFDGVNDSIHFEVRLAHFDRCTGTFSNYQTISTLDSVPGLSLTFSPNSTYLYWSSYNKIYQLNTDTINIAASQQLVAVKDGYCFPYSWLCTDFRFMYLAANGKIYISSGSSVLDLHYIEYPDSSGLACSVQQHALRLPCYSGRGHANHPNYALGPVAGSVCDSLGVGVHELDQIRNVSLHPNPIKSGGSFTLYYELPQNKAGLFSIQDAVGREVYHYYLPLWSNMQGLTLPSLQTGIYFGRITSASSTAAIKMVVQ